LTWRSHACQSDLTAGLAHMGKDTGPLALAAAQVATQRAKIKALL
jgi:hypothetical protein